MLRSATATII